MDKQVAREFLEAHNTLREIANQIAPYEERYLSHDGLGSAGMEVDGVYDHYLQLSNARNAVVDTLTQIRAKAQTKDILAELAGMEGGKPAEEYLQKVSLRESREVGREKRKGFFGLFR